MDDVQLGDIVRSYDFPDLSTDDYIVGIVVNIGIIPELFEYSNILRYKIKITRRVSSGKDVPFTESFVYPPINGLLTTSGERTRGVKIISQ